MLISDCPQVSGVLSQRCVSASAVAGQAHVHNQLHGDGQGDWRVALQPTHPWPANQGRLPATAQGKRYYVVLIL